MCGRNRGSFNSTHFFGTHSAGGGAVHSIIRGHQTKEGCPGSARTPNFASRPTLLRCQSWHLRLHDWRWIPLAGQRLRLRRIEAHGEIVRPFRRRQPVRLLVGTRTLVLEVKIERAVRIIFERHPARDGEAIDRVRDLKAFGIIEGDRPEGLRRRGLVLNNGGVDAKGPFYR
jgi:hypothetical protein